LQISSLGFQVSDCEGSEARFQLPGSELANLRSQIAFDEPRPGFTLLELMVVLTILLILATMSMPIFNLAIVHAREAVLKDDLYTLRKLIDEYTLDKQKPPSSLSDLVDAGYLRSGLPVDPFTGSSETWQTDTEDVPTSPSQTATGIVNVHSGADGTALDGTAYSSW
jgi:general secretion pathway protein G